MQITKKVEIEEVNGVWIVTTNDHSQAYPQTSVKDYIRFMKDLLKQFELNNMLEVKERV